MAHVPVIDEISCVAHGECAELAPEAFRVEDVAVVIGTAPAERLLAIAESCPSSAISVIEETTGEQVYP